MRDGTYDDARWHFDKRIPIALVIVILIQTGGMVWWAANISARVDALERTTISRSDRGDRITRVETKLESVGASIARLEGKIDRWLDDLRRSL